MGYKNKIKVIPARLTEYPLIQNMARFYVYELSRTCGFLSPEWNLPSDGLYESFDFKNYFTDPTRKAFLIKVGQEIAGFLLLNQAGTIPETHWNMGEFFILAKFQSQGIGKYVAYHIWDKLPGLWEISVIPENTAALTFWKKIIQSYSLGNYHQQNKTILYDESQPQRIVFTFNAAAKIPPKKEGDILIRFLQGSDIFPCVMLSYQKRRRYEKAQPQFWKYAGKKAQEIQTKWFERLITQPDAILLVAEVDKKITGFIIGQLINAPGVYDPGGLTLMIDDFCMKDESCWQQIGSKLLDEIKNIAISKGAVQIVVVCGAHDGIKQRFLEQAGLKAASKWFVGKT